MSSKETTEICCVCCGLCIILFLVYYIWISYPEYLVLTLITISLISFLIAIGRYIENTEKKKKQRQKEEEDEAWRIAEAERKERYENEQKAKGMFKFIDRNGNERWGFPREIKEWKRIDLGLRNNFAQYSPREFEEFIGELFERMGYDVQLGSYVGDYGVDLILKKDNRRILVEVKKYATGHNVGNREIRATLGAVWNKAEKAIFITTSDFTEQAYEQAERTPIELWNRQTLEKYIEQYFFEDNASKSGTNLTEKKDANIADELPPKPEEKKKTHDLGKIEADLDDRTKRAAQSEKSEKLSNIVVVHGRSDCEHKNTRQFSKFNVRGEPRRVVTQCVDCGKILKIENIGR